MTWLREHLHQRTRLVYLALMRVAIGYYCLTLAWPTLTAGGEGAGDLVALGELVVGVSLVTGLLVRVGATLGALQSLSIYLSATSNAVLGFNRLLILLQVAFVVASAGRSFGLDGWLHRKWPHNPLF